MKLVVGLGNPGRKYAQTRHNVGFRVLAELARRLGAGPPRNKFHGEYCEVQVAQERVLLLCPQTYMNKSGASVLAARDFYKIENDRLLVVCDDLNLPLGRLRARPGGSAGGQKGLDDVIRRLGTQEVPRLRLGIGPTPGGWDASDYVLSKFLPEELSTVDDTLARAADATLTWLQEGIEACMNQFNSPS